MVKNAKQVQKKMTPGMKAGRTRGWRVAALVVAAFMLISLAACGGGTNGGTTAASVATTTTTTAAATEATKAAATTAAVTTEATTAAAAAATTAATEETTAADAGTTTVTTAAQTPETTAAASESTRNAGKEPITFKLLMYNWTTWDEPMNADPVGRWITEQTGVTLDVEMVTGDYAEKASLLLATGDYPDLMLYDSNIMPRYIKEGALIDYGEYLDVLPNVISKYGIEAINSMRDINDGKLYHLNQWFSGNYKLMSEGFNIRHDLMAEHFGEVANTKHIFTLAEIDDFFRSYKEAHPTTPDGAEVFPLTDQGGNLWKTAGGQLFGIINWYETDDNRILPYYMDPGYVRQCIWLNSLYRERLLDPEFAINTTEMNERKLTNGASIAIFSHYAAWSNVNSALMAEYGPEAYLFSHYHVAEVPGKEKYYVHGGYGGSGLSVTKNCKDIPRVMEFIDFLSEPLANFIECNGIFGGVWDFDGDGKIVVNYDALDAMPDLWDRFRTYGAYKYVFTLSEGTDSRLADIYPVDEIVPAPILDWFGRVAKDIEGRTKYWDQDEIYYYPYASNLAPDKDSDLALTEQDISDIFNERIVHIVMAPSEAECVNIYNAMVDEIKATEGFDAYIAFVSERYYRQKAIVLGE